MYKIRLSERSRQDYIDILEHKKQFYPGTAGRFADALHEKTSLLVAQPFMCPEYPPRPKYRKMVVMDYLVFYTVDEQAKVITLSRIVNGTSDYEKALGLPL